MIGKALPFGKGFLGIVRYLERGAAGEERERVEWVESRNLPTEDLETAARLMAAWARESVRTQRPVYHLVISADPGDPADRPSLSRVADRVLDELGLSEHQVLIIAHNDTAHPHMHLVVNRVHPETHLAWENSFDWPKIEKALRAEEVALGWRVVPGKHAPVPGHGPPAPELAKGSPAFLRLVQERGGPVLAAATSWVELEEELEAVGLRLRIKGGGYTIHDGRQEVKASDVNRAFSRRFMEERLGKLSEYRRTRGAAPTQPAHELEAPVPEPVRTPDDVRTLPAQPEPVVPVPEPVRPATEPPRPPSMPPAPRPTPALDRIRERLRSPAAPAEPTSPEERFLARLRAVSERQGGVLPDLERAAGLVYRAREWWTFNERFTSRVVNAESAAEELRRLEEARSRADIDGGTLRESLARVYTDPEAAALRLAAYHRTQGPERVREALRTAPQEFGELKRVYPWWGLGIVYSTAAARRHAAYRVDGPLDDAIRSAPQRPSAGVIAEAKQRARETERELAEMREKLRGFMNPGVAEAQAADLLAPLARGYGADWIAREFTRLIPPEDRKAVEIAARVVSRATRDAIGRGRSRERERDKGIDFF